MVSRLGCPSSTPRARRRTRRAASRFTATLDEPLPWTVASPSQSADVVARGRRGHRRWTGSWDARTVPAGRYMYAIDAGPTVRPATGFVSGTLQRAVLTALARPALITPNGDGRREMTTVQLRLREPSIVTADTRRLARCAADAALHRSRSPPVVRPSAGTQPVLPDGRYGIVLSARSALGIETTATVTVIVNRALVGLERIVPQVFSPNADGRLDTTQFRFGLNGPARVAVVRRGREDARSGLRRPAPAVVRRRSRGTVASRDAWGSGRYKVVVRATTPVPTVVQSVDFAWICPRPSCGSCRRPSCGSRSTSPPTSP